MQNPNLALTLLTGVALASVALPTSTAQVLYSDNFDSDTSASWNINNAAVNPGGNSALFNFDYSSVGIPAAPGSGGTTRGLRLEANVSGGAQTGLSVSPTGLVLPNEYILRFNLWHNFNGPAPGGGNGSTQVSGAGVGTAGTSAQWAGSPTYDAVFFGATGDGGSTIDYRVYPVANTAAANSGFYAAGTASDSRSEANPYYSSFGNVPIPASQTALFSQQTGSTAPGAQGFAWHDVQITKLADSIEWTVDGIRLATVPTDSLGGPLGGNNFLLNHYDINATSSTDPNATLLLFGLFDNVTVSAVPEPSTLAFAGLFGTALAAGALRKRRA